MSTLPPTYPENSPIVVPRVKAMNAEARLTSTLTAHRFYLSRGWADAGDVERYAGMVAYPMRKTL